VIFLLEMDLDERSAFVSFFQRIDLARPVFTVEDLSNGAAILELLIIVLVFT